MNTMLLTARLDDRVCEGRIGSRIGLEAAAFVFDGETDMTSLIETEQAKTSLACVMVDEAQFLTDAQVWQLADVADRLRIPVMCYGLRTDSRAICFREAPAFWRSPTCCAKSGPSAIAAARQRWWYGRMVTAR